MQFMHVCEIPETEIPHRERACHDNFNTVLIIINKLPKTTLYILYWQLRNCWLKFILFREWSIYSNYLVVKRFVCTPFTYILWVLQLSFYLYATNIVVSIHPAHIYIYTSALVNNHIIDINKGGWKICLHLHILVLY